MSSSRSQFRWQRWLLVTAATAALLLGATPAGAHNALKATNPEADSQVSQTPAQVVLTFDEPALAMGTVVVITGPDGPVQTGTPKLVDNTVTQAVRPGAPAGRYTVEWRITSADGHPISGSFTFTTAAAGSGTPSEPAAPAPQTTPTDTSASAVPLVLAVIGVAVIGLLVATVLRRRRTVSVPPDSNAEPPETH